nr:hypothetical protein [Rhizobium sp. AAP43]
MRENAINEDALDSEEASVVPDCLVGIVAMRMWIATAAEEATLGVKRSQRCLEDRACPVSMQACRFDDATTTVHRPDRRGVDTDQFLADEVGSIEITVEIASVIAKIGDVVAGCASVLSLPLEQGENSRSEVAVDQPASTGWQAHLGVRTGKSYSGFTPALL